MSESGEFSAPKDAALTTAERVRLDALRYVANTEVADYVTIMRVFTSGTSGLMADLSAGEIAERLAGDHGVVLDESTVEDRLSYVTAQGNLARSPRETTARSIEEYLRTRARFQLTTTGELAGRIATVFNQHRSLVESTREFYSYLGQVLGRYDLSREDFRVFKTVLIDYLTRFVDDIAKHLPRIGELLERLQPRTAALVARANEGAGCDAEVRRCATTATSTGRASRSPTRLVEQVGVRPWLMAAPDYISGTARTRLALEGPPVQPSWDPALGTAMAANGVAVPEEVVLDTILAAVTP